MPRRAASAAAPSSGRSLLWLQGLLCGALLMLAPAMAVVAGALLAPGLVSLALDAAPGRPTARTVLLFGAAGAVTPLHRYWRLGHGMDAAIAVAGDTGALAPAWMTAALGWLIAELLPVLLRAGLEAYALARAARLKSARAKYAEEWETGG